jgi:hypothetical protein
MEMSLYVFLSVCVLGMDFLIFVLFQWMYADKRKAMARKLAECRKAEEKKVAPFVVHPRGVVTQMRLQKVRERMAGREPRVA